MTSQKGLKFWNSNENVWVAFYELEAASFLVTVFFLFLLVLISSASSENFDKETNEEFKSI